VILNQLGIFGWKEADEPIAPVCNSLFSLRSSSASAAARFFDPFAFGKPSRWSAKTHVANRVAQALERTFLVYDASKVPRVNAPSARERVLGHLQAGLDRPGR
jgi:hypothetical protein